MVLNMKLGKPNRIYVEGKTLNQIAEESGIALDTVRHRYSRGVRTYEGLTKPTAHNSNVDRQYAKRKSPMYIMGSGERFMEEILKKDISLSHLSRCTGISRSTIYAFVYDNIDISSARLAKLCAVVGVSTDYILGLSGGKNV